MKLLLFTFFQDSKTYDSGYDIGYTIGKYLPLIVIVLVAYFAFRYFNNKSQR